MGGETEYLDPEGSSDYLLEKYDIELGQARIRRLLKRGEIQALARRVGGTFYFIYSDTIGELESYGTLPYAALSARELAESDIRVFLHGEKFEKSPYIESHVLDEWAERYKGNLNGASSSQVQRKKPVNNSRIAWIKTRLKSKGVNLPLIISKGGPAGIKAELKREALVERRDLFTESTFDRAWKAIPKMQS